MSPQKPGLLLLLLLLAGCAPLGPDFKPPAAPLPPDWSAWHGGALADPALRRQTGTAAAVFDDPLLVALQARALAANPDLQTAALRFAQSRAQRRTVAAQGAPQLNANAGAARQRQSESGAATRLIDVIAPANRDALVSALSDPFNVYQAGFDASWELDLWGRVRRSIEAADAGVAGAAASLRLVQLSVASEVARNYVELRGAQRQTRLEQADVDAAAETLELLAARAEGGLDNDLESTRQQGQMAELRARLPALLEQQAQAINQLTLLTGAPPGALQDELAAPAEMDDAGALPDLALGMPSDVVARRPDIQTAQARLHAATAGIGLATADLYPRLTLGATFGLESVSASQFGDWGSRLWSVGPSLSLPLFDHGRRRATVELRELEQQEAAVAYQQTVLRAWHEIDSALSGYTAERQRRQQLADKERSSAAALQLARTRRASGLTDLLPELAARRALLQAQRDYAQSSNALTLRLLSIDKALGLAP